MVLSLRDIKEDDYLDPKELEMLDLLESFKIKVKSINVKRNSFFCHYYIRLAPGMKYSKLDGLLCDIGMHLGALSTPTGRLNLKAGNYKISVQEKEIIAPVPSDIRPSTLKALYSPIFIGASATEEALIRDMSKMPNLIIAGSSGSGKSSLLHSIAISSLQNGSILFISDPKMVEFSEYKGLPSVKGVALSYDATLNMLDEVITIMNARFANLKKKGIRSATLLAEMNGTKEAMPPILLIIDEWSDLALQGKEIHTKLLSIAQKGRASGISIILSTQHPSAKIISSSIKANFPGRISLKTTSSAASRMIIGKNGAEMLHSPGQGLMRDYVVDEPTYFQAPFISDVKKELSKCGLEKKRGLFRSLFS